MLTLTTQSQHLLLSQVVVILLTIVPMKPEVTNGTTIVYTTPAIRMVFLGLPIRTLSQEQHILTQLQQTQSAQSPHTTRWRIV